MTLNHSSFLHNTSFFENSAIPPLMALNRESMILMEQDTKIRWGQEGKTAKVFRNSRNILIISCLVPEGPRLLVVQRSSRHGRIYYSDPDDGILSTGKTIYQSLSVRLYVCIALFVRVYSHHPSLYSMVARPSCCRI